MMHDDALFTLLMDAVGAAEDIWRTEADRMGIISGQHRRCLVVSNLLCALAARLDEREGAYLSPIDLTDLAAWMIRRRHEETDALRARIKAVQGESP